MTYDDVERRSGWTKDSVEGHVHSHTFIHVIAASWILHRMAMAAGSEIAEDWRQWSILIRRLDSILFAGFYDAYDSPHGIPASHLWKFISWRVISARKVKFEIGRDGIHVER